MSNQNYFPNPKNPIKWRSINKINLSHLKNSRDINILQSYLDNLICGQISEEDIQKAVKDAEAQAEEDKKKKRYDFGIC